MMEAFSVCNRATSGGPKDSTLRLLTASSDPRLKISQSSVKHSVCCPESLLLMPVRRVFIRERTAKKKKKNGAFTQEKGEGVIFRTISKMVRNQIFKSRAQTLQKTVQGSPGREPAIAAVVRFISFRTKSELKMSPDPSQQL